VIAGHCEERSDEAIQSSAPRDRSLNKVPGGASDDRVESGSEDWIASLRSQ
jgi:hypothetical protein